MTRQVRADICIIGAGSGGLSVAAGAARLGARTVLIERGRMGGDCLNWGCVPSKALLAAAKRAHLARQAAAFGIGLPPPEVDFQAVMAHVASVVAGIAPHDSAERFTGLGVQVIRADARFTGRDRLRAGEVEVRARRFVIATGSRPAVPPIPGLDTVAFMTNETVFEADSLPGHLLVLGAGPVGLELAQAHRRLGAEVTVIEAGRALSKEDPELAAVVIGRLRAEGVTIREGARAAAVARLPDGGLCLDLEGGDRVAGSHLLVATGRRPNIEDLGLEAAGVATSPAGIVVDGGLRTANRRIFAVGDVAGGAQFTHLAAHHAAIVLRRALFRMPGRAAAAEAVPRATYTDPELAAVGLSEAEARARHGAIRILRAPLAENDRVRAERLGGGLVKVIVSRRGRILGAGIAGPSAGELILPWTLALTKGLKIGAMAEVIAPYPTLGESGKRAAGRFFARLLFSGRTRRLVRFLARFG